MKNIQLSDNEAYRLYDMLFDSIRDSFYHHEFGRQIKIDDIETLNKIGRSLYNEYTDFTINTIS